MAFKASLKRGINVKRVVAKVAVTIIVLYIGGTILKELGSVMNHTHSPFYKGLSLIGWTVGAPGTNGSHYTACDGGTVSHVLASDPTGATCITSTTGAGILTVVGLVAIAAIVMEFVEFSF